jgi:succinate-semialdehyde dehydrogenase/glutarate-semialdehyde dehydrogenase
VIAETRNLVGGQWVTAGASEASVEDPATGKEIARIPHGDGAYAKQAIDAAQQAFPAWRDKTASERAALLRKLSAAMIERVEELAALMTAEQGKPLAESRGEIRYATSFLDFAVGEAERIYGETIPAAQPHKRILVLRQPVGVTAAITPWNFPAAMITRKLGPALAAGCTMVVKPAEQTPLSAIAIGKIATEVGFPPGVVNVVTGDAKAIGNQFLEDPRVRKLSFTGSTEVGKLLIAGSAKTVTRLSLELGGHAPFIVFDDASVDAAVKGALASKFRNMGQTCISPNRFYVQAGIYDAFVAALAEAVAKMKVGPGNEPDVAVGPLIDDDAVEKVREHVADAVNLGARVKTGGKTVKVRDGLSDRFFAPTVLEGIDKKMRLAQEETFGPVAPIQKFASEDEAVALANDSEFGLASYLFTRDVARAWRVAERLEYGIVGLNDGAPSTAQAPFGGVKQSGFGREGGHHVMHEYLNVKYVSWNLS